MPSAGSLLARVRKLERNRAESPSPFAVWYGSFENFENECRAEMASGALDRDFPIAALARWERERLHVPLHRRQRCAGPAINEPGKGVLE